MNAKVVESELFPRRDMTGNGLSWQGIEGRWRMACSVRAMRLSLVESLARGRHSGHVGLHRIRL